MDAPLERLSRLVERQQEEISGLRREAAACREEVAVLRECLFAEGVLRPSLLRWWALKRQASAQQVARFNEMLQVEGVALLVGLYAGPVALRAAGGCSALVCTAAGDAWPAVRQLRRWCVYLCGGGQSADSHLPERFTPQLGAWDTLPPMQENRMHGFAAVVQGGLYVCGGASSRGVLDSVERFDPVAAVWDSMPPMLAQRQRFSGGALQGQLYVCGGINDHDTSALSAGERFDPASASWEELRLMNQRRASSVAGVLGSQLFVCGGVRSDFGGGELRSVECLNPATGAWQVMPPMLGQRASAAATVLDGRLYVCGGISGMEILSSVECFDPEAGCWAAEPWMLVGRFWAMAAAAGGHIYVFGGQSGLRYSNSVENSVEQFDPVRRTWVTLPPMQERRSRAMAAVALE